MMESQDLKKLPNLDASKINEDKTDVLLEEPKVNPSTSSIINNTTPKLLAWCSEENNQISIVDLETKQEYANFKGTKISDTEYNWTHVKEIPNTTLLVSLHNDEKSANLEIFDISKKGQAQKIYSLGEVKGVVGFGDVTYNIRRKILGAIPLGRQMAYHLFRIDANASNVNKIVKIYRKSKWHPPYSDDEGLDFNLLGEFIATIDRYGVCLISDVNTNSSNLHLKMSNYADPYGRCRWSSNTGEPLLYIKYDWKMLNILDAEKKALTLNNPVQLEDSYKSLWIDVCQSDGNLLASGGNDHNIKIFDSRASKIVKTFDRIHSDWINCVRWSPNGDMLASASADTTVKLWDFKTGKVIHTGNGAGGKYADSVCFI